MIILPQLLQMPELRDAVSLIVAFLGILATFATVITMFASLKNKLEDLSKDVRELQEEAKETRKKLELLIRLEEQIKHFENRQKGDFGRT